VTAISCASSSLLKEKEKEIQKKRNIKSGKIDKRKRKRLVSKAFHNIKMMRCLEECGTQWRPKQEKPGWQKQKQEEAKEEAGKRREEKAEKQKKKKPKRERMIEVKRVAEEWEIWDEEEEVAKSEAEVKKLVSEQFHK